MRRSAMLGLVMVAATALAGCTSTTGSQGTSASSLTPGASMVSPVLASFSSSAASASSSGATSISASTAPNASSRSVSVSPTVTSSTATSAPSKTTLTTTSVTSVTSKSGASVKSSTAVSSRTTATSRAAASVPTAQTSGLSSEEIGDRSEIQATWVRYWDVVEGIVKAPKTKRQSLLRAVAVDPVVSNVLAQSRTFDANGWDNYGTVTHRPYWGPPVAGNRVAIMGDCIDLSKAGRLKVKGSEKLTVGVPRSNVRGSFERQKDGTWRVTGLTFLKDTQC